MKLHEHNEDFKVIISRAAEHFNMPEHVVEKDYWVTKLLHNLFNYQYKEFVIFKGGTSLSKGFKLINRFSEDIDLALHPAAIQSGKIHKREGEALHRVLKAIKDESFIDEKDGKESEKKRYKRVYTFPQSFRYPEGVLIHGKIVLEVNCFSTPIPSENVEIRSLAAEFLEQQQGPEALKDLSMEPFFIKALKPERAFCEKLLALRRAGYKGGQFFADRIRHAYDIHQLYSSQRIINLTGNNSDFHSMLNLCYQDDELNQKISSEHAPNFSSFDIFNAPHAKLDSVKTEYNKLQDITFNKSIPSIEEVSTTLKEINDCLTGFAFELEA